MLGPKNRDKRKKAVIPAGERVYAIGDVHGRADLAVELLNAINAEVEGYSGLTTVVFLGDYVDRGPQSKQVLEHLSQLNEGDQRKYVFLIGNHEQVMMDFLADAPGSEHWLRYGGLETLESYGIEIHSEDLTRQSLSRVREAFRQALPERQRQFLRRLKLFYEIGGYYFCHAGVRPGVDLTAQDIDDLIWIREPFLSSNADLGRIVVHGHSITDAPVVRANRIGVDTGAFATGRLTAVVLEGEGMRFLST